MRQLAIITGASSGIGTSYAEHLAAEGWDLAVIARRQHLLEELRGRLEREHGGEVEVIAADLSEHEEIGRVVELVAGLEPDMLVNNAALAHYMPFSDLPPEKADELVTLNVMAPVALTRAVIPGMRARSRGAVINVASLLAFSGPREEQFMPARAVYAASKSFIVTFTQILASELKDSGVRVQVVCPGMVRTEFHSRQGIDMSAVPRMEPNDVVLASLQDLDRGVVLSVPPLADVGALEQLTEVDGVITSAARTRELPERYRRS